MSNADRRTMPDRARVRARLAVGLTACALGVAALVAIGSVALASWRSSDADSAARGGIARVGPDVAVVVVTGQGADAAADDARRDALVWMLVALGASLVPAIGLGWFAAGKLLGRVDRALAETQAAEEERQRRLQEVVHELRTPLAVVGTNLELAASEPTLDEDTATLVDAARRATERMSRTVDDLAGHGRLAILPGDGPVDVAATVRPVVGEHAGPARAHGLALAWRAAEIPPIAMGDRQALRTCTSNLLSNAVRLAPAGSTIRVEVGEQHGWVWVAVTDEGPGLAPAIHGRVFERGWRGRHERDRATRADEGRGLGLTISRQLIEAQGGRITVESAEGTGSTFTLWLPRSAASRAADVVAADGVHPVARPWSAGSDATPADAARTAVSV